MCVQWEQVVRLDVRKDEEQDAFLALFIGSLFAIASRLADFDRRLIRVGQIRRGLSPEHLITWIAR